MEFKSCSLLRREVGVNIYRWSFKTSRWVVFSGENRLNRPWQVWQTDAQSNQVDQTG
jgi:hypothetical protein